MSNEINKALNQPQADESINSEKTVAIDEAELLSRMGGDRDCLVSVIEVFLEESDSLLEEVRAAVSGRDPALLERAAHKLKGCSSIFSSKPAQAALTLERMGRTRELDGCSEALITLEAQFQELRLALLQLSKRL